MNRILSLALGVAMLSGAASAAEYRVDTTGKSPAEVRAAVQDVAFKACKVSYSGDYFADYKRDACVKDTVKETFNRANQTARSAPVSQETTVASR